MDREGPLTRLTNFVYRLVVIELAFVVATAPALIGILFLEQHPSNIPYYAGFALFFGPAISAGIYAWRADQDLVPWLRFWKGWVESFRQSMIIWTPVVALCGLVAFNSAYAQVPGAFIIGGVVLACAASVTGIGLLVIVANFTFRTRDLFSVMMYGAASSPLGALGIITSTVLAGAVVVFWSDWVLALLASFMLVLLARIVRPMIVQINADLIDRERNPHV